MKYIKKIGAFIAIALLAVIAFLTGQKDLKPRKDPYEDEQKALEDKLQDIEDNGVDVKDLSHEEVKKFWKK